ncbi:MAG: MotA/TolQ/ExbB proton channel family protein [Betaproteobacteria bacterium]|nr:MotA/TolQ/ExbB proton channel family protein [Betaproteobacteria bacterium]
MSIATWYLILAKGWRIFRIRRGGWRAIEAIWRSPRGGDALEQLARGSADDPFFAAARVACELAQRREAAREADNGAASAADEAEYATRALRRSIRHSLARLDGGLTVLASVGATAPFIGLFGTVWGIYHALIAIGFTGQATIDKVAGPVGEALIMTAFGLAVAIPAVVAYNLCVRTNRAVAAELDGFAHDAHAIVMSATATPAAAPAPVTGNR